MTTTTALTAPQPAIISTATEVNRRRWRTWSTQVLPTDVRAPLEALGVLDDNAITVVEELIKTLEYFLAGTPDAGTAVQRFIDDTTSWHAHAERLAVVRIAERLSGMPAGAPWVGPALPLGVMKRPLLDPEHGMLLWMAKTNADDRAATAIGVMCAGGSSGELAELPPHRFSVNGGVVSVDLPGLCNVQPRCAELSPFFTPIVTRLLDRHAQTRPADAPLLYTGDSSNHGKRQCAMLTGIKKTLHKAALGNATGISPESFRLHGARGVKATKGIEGVADFLGMKSLDRARKLFLDW